MRDKNGNFLEEIEVISDDDNFYEDYTFKYKEDISRKIEEALYEANYNQYSTEYKESQLINI